MFFVKHFYIIKETCSYTCIEIYILSNHVPCNKKKKTRKKLPGIAWYLLEYRLIYGISYINMYIIYSIVEYVP